MTGSLGSDLGACALGYITGSIPFGLWMGRATAGVDVRDFGSGSMGTTNVLRSAGPAAAGAVFALDIAKGGAAVVAARALGASPIGAAATGVAAAVGHSWPVLARFRGGKSVAVALGSLMALTPPAVPAVSVIGGTTVLLTTRFVSLGSLSAAALATVGSGVVWARGGPGTPFAFAVADTALIVARHSANLRRLARGEEPRIGLGRLRRRGGGSSAEAAAAS